MRFLRLFILVVIIILSHRLVFQKMDVNVSTQVSIQQDLTIILAEIIQNAVPKAQGINFQYIKSHSVNENAVESNFSVSFINPDGPNPVKVTLEGKAVLSRVFENEKPTGNWTVESFTLGDQDIEFQEGMVIEASLLGVKTSPTPEQKLDPAKVTPPKPSGTP